jgi:hypothetical protein
MAPEHDRAAVTARSVAVILQPLQIDSAGTILAPDVEFVDHQTLGLGSARGTEAFLRGVAPSHDVADDRAMRNDDVVGLRSDALIVQPDRNCPRQRLVPTSGISGALRLRS